MTSSYDLGRQALAKWRSIHGNATLDQQCIRFDGYYWQWVYQGNENIRSYSTATAAADASPMYTTNVNDPNAQPGDLWYWWWAREGHVGTVLGHDANGRVLVTHTSSSGSLVEQWSNNVRISHADTIPHQFRGGSHHYGSNIRRTGLTAWPTAKPTPPKPDERTTHDMLIRDEAGSVYQADDFGSDHIPDNLPGVASSELIYAAEMLSGKMVQVNNRQRDLINAYARNRWNRKRAEIVAEVAAKVAPAQVDTAAIVKGITDVITAKGIKIDATEIAAAVDAALKDDFAAIPASIGKKLS